MPQRLEVHGILIKRSTIVDLNFCTPRGSDVQICHKTSKKGLKNIQKSIDALLHLANCTLHDMPNLGSFWVVKIQGGQCALCPLIKISLMMALDVDRAYNLQSNIKKADIIYPAAGPRVMI